MDNTDVIPQLLKYMSSRKLPFGQDHKYDLTHSDHMKKKRGEYGKFTPAQLDTIPANKRQEWIRFYNDQEAKNVYESINGLALHLPEAGKIRENVQRFIYSNRTAFNDSHIETLKHGYGISERHHDTLKEKWAHIKPHHDKKIKREMLENQVADILVRNNKNIHNRREAWKDANKSAQRILNGDEYNYRQHDSSVLQQLINTVPHADYAPIHGAIHAVLNEIGKRPTADASKRDESSASGHHLGTSDRGVRSDTPNRRRSRSRSRSRSKDREGGGPADPTPAPQVAGGTSTEHRAMSVEPLDAAASDSPEHNSEVLPIAQPDPTVSSSTEEDEPEQPVPTQLDDATGTRDSSSMPQTELDRAGQTNSSSTEEEEVATQPDGANQAFTSSPEIPTQLDYPMGTLASAEGQNEPYSARWRG